LPWVAAIFFGIWLGHEKSKGFIADRLKGLKFHDKNGLPTTDRNAFLNTQRGVFSTLGPLPFKVHPLPRLERYSFTDLQEHCPPELAQSGDLAKLYGRFLGPTARQKHGAHVDLFDALAMTLLHPDNLPTPAGIDRHAGRSLLMHTLLVGGLMFQRVQTHVYIPSRGFSAENIDFALDRNDPLIPILALAHDIGKIRKIVIDSSGRALSLLPKHNAQAARDVAQIAEFWSEEISPEDRYIIQTVLSYSGNTANMPIEKTSNDALSLVTSDRLHALSGLLAECDRIAGSIEMGGRYTFNEPATSVDADLISESLMKGAHLWDSLVKYFAFSMPINTLGPVRSIGYKYVSEDFSRGRHVIVIDELAFLTSFALFMKQPALSTRDGKSSALTKKTLELIDENGFLFRFAEGENVAIRPATSCLYKINNCSAAATPKKDDDANLSSAFILDVTEWRNMQHIKNMPSCLSSPSFAGFRLGRQTGKSIKKTQGNLDFSPELLGIDALGAESATLNAVGATFEAKVDGKENATTAAVSVDDLAQEGLVNQAQTANLVLSEITTAGVAVEKAHPSDLNDKLAKSERPEKVVQRIGHLLLKGEIKIAAVDGQAIAIVGYDSHFQKLGVEVMHYDTIPKEFELIGILQITRSLKTQGTHVIKLDRSIYEKFTATLLSN
jgi:hypothetical protein